MTNNIPSFDRNKQLETIADMDIDYAPLQGYELGSIMDTQNSTPDRQTKFVSSGALSWRTLERYARFSYPIFTVVTTRLRLLASARMTIVPKKNYEDDLKTDIDHYRQLYNEFKEDDTDEGRKIAYDSIIQLKKRLPFLKNDISNIYSCFERERKTIRDKRNSDVSYLFNFLKKPNIHEDWAVMITKMLWDYLVHVEGYIYKIPTLGRAVQGIGKYSQLVSLKGPTMQPIEGDKVLSLSGYRQTAYSGYNNLPYHTVDFETDEIMRFQYLPTNSYIFSLSPMEAIYKLLNEQLYYDKQRTEEFDLGKPPLGVLAIDGHTMKATRGEAMKKPLSEDQRSRVENALNRRSKLDRIKILQGVGKSQYHSLSRSERDSGGLQRQEQILDIAAKVYNMTPQEVNLIKDVNRSTAGQQARSEAIKGLRPHLDLIANEFYYDLFVPMGFGNYELKFEEEIDKSVWDRVDKMLAVMGENEVRRKVGLDEYPENEFDRPPAYRQERIASSEEAMSE